MARPRKCRRICIEPEYLLFTPDGIGEAESVTLTLDEYEVIRLVDHQKLTHEQCAKQMDISLRNRHYNNKRLLFLPQL